MSKLLPAEQACLDHLANAWNTFVALEHANPDMVTEFRHGIHALQNEIMARPTRRLLEDVARAERIADALKRKAQGETVWPSLCHMDDMGAWVVAEACCMCRGAGHLSDGRKCDGIPF